MACSIFRHSKSVTSTASNKHGVSGSFSLEGERCCCQSQQGTHRCNCQPEQQESQPCNGLEIQTNANSIHGAQLSASGGDLKCILGFVAELEGNGLRGGGQTSFYWLCH